MVTKLKSYRYEIFLFFLEAVCMALELCASRTLSPYFGDSNVIWTSIIGIILFSGSIGNAIGGKIADEKHAEQCLCKATLLASVLVLYIPILSSVVLSIIVALISNLKLAAIIGTILLFLPSSLVFGTVPPVVFKLKLNNLETVGKTSGEIQAVSAIGSIFGTFFAGFFLVPNFGCYNILFFLAAFTALLSLLIAGKRAVKYIGLLIIISAVCVSIFIQAELKNHDEILSGVMDCIAEYDTQYSHVRIANTIRDGEEIRCMIVGNGCESITYIDETQKYELASIYTRYYDLMYQAPIEIKNALMIGGGGYAYPKYCVSHHNETNLDVVEIDAQITELAKKYFYLDDALEEFNSTDHIRLNLIHEDGKVYINTSNQKYDAILNDAFTGKSPVKTLSTIESVQQIHNMLNSGGVYLTNIVGSRHGDGSGFLLAEAYTISKVFQYVYVVPCVEDDRLVLEDEITNNMVIASDTPLNIPDAVEIDFSNAIVLTDDYCPVDALIPDEG